MNSFKNHDLIKSDHIRKDIQKFSVSVFYPPSNSIGSNIWARGGSLIEWPGWRLSVVSADTHPSDILTFPTNQANIGFLSNLSNTWQTHFIRVTAWINLTFAADSR